MTIIADTLDAALNDFYCRDQLAKLLRGEVDSIYILGKIYRLPTQPSPDLQPFENSEVKHKCAKCGLDFTGLMGYVCGDPRCPMYPYIS